MGKCTCCHLYPAVGAIINGGRRLAELCSSCHDVCRHLGLIRSKTVTSSGATYERTPLGKHVEIELQAGEWEDSGPVLQRMSIHDWRRKAELD